MHAFFPPCSMFYDGDDDEDTPEEVSPGLEAGDYSPPEDMPIPGEGEAIENDEL